MIRRSIWRSPFDRYSLISSPFGEPNRQWHRLLTSTETNKAYEITTELLGMDEKNVEVR